MCQSLMRNRQQAGRPAGRRKSKAGLGAAAAPCYYPLDGSGRCPIPCIWPAAPRPAFDLRRPAGRRPPSLLPVTHQRLTHAGHRRHAAQHRGVLLPPELPPFSDDPPACGWELFSHRTSERQPLNVHDGMRARLDDGHAWIRALSTAPNGRPCAGAPNWRADLSCSGRSHCASGQCPRLDDARGAPAAGQLHALLLAQLHDLRRVGADQRDPCAPPARLVRVDRRRLYRHALLVRTQRGGGAVRARDHL